MVQAKFLQRPKNTDSDGKWALTELENELKAFSKSKKRRLPEFYIFATNVVLSPNQNSGKKDKAFSIVKKYEKKIPLKGFAIWDHDEISKYLDSFENIRKAYACWITPGDVLSEVINQLRASRPNFLNVISNFLAKELRSDQFANLEQAGHSIDDKVPLARVFVDLPVTSRRVTEPPTENGGGYQEGETVIEVVSHLLDKAKEPLDPASCEQETRSPEEKLRQPHRQLPGRYVLIGGPGQGKTTVGQFACQLFRVAILQDRPSNLLPPEIQHLIGIVKEQCSSGALEVPKSRRFPIRIVLSEFSTAVNANADISVLAFILQQIAKATDQNITPDDLRLWLENYPWFLVFDGLDEVPSSTNRALVLKKIEDFWIDAAQLNADILVLATTRPQGYSNDFSPEYYHHLWLAPLSSGRAIKYAKRLVEVRYADEGDRQKKIFDRLKRASVQDSTARLMRSPLQITIMASLVDQTGNPPQDRWRLFHDYYEVIYNRERERPIPAAELLRDYKPNIDAIHHQVGLVLQVESERAGGAEAKLPAERFAKLVTARLEEEEFSGVDLIHLRERIIDAAANRLVFLVGLEAGQVGFEIRSLQEYMASEAIMTGSQNKVQDRLRRLAPISSWRNVFLFAAGRCFLQEQHFRDTIHTICVELNDNLSGPIGHAALAGSTLALDLLEDGIARLQPKYARLLGKCAANLLDLPPSEVHARLADACVGEFEAVIKEIVIQRLSIRDAKWLSAWNTLLPLLGRDIQWARELAVQAWPVNEMEQVTIFKLPAIERADAWRDSRIHSLIKANPPSEVWHLSGRRSVGGHRRRGTRGNPASKVVPFYEVNDWPYWHQSGGEVKININGIGAAVLLFPIEFAQERAKEIEIDEEGVHPYWVPLLEEIKFSRNPSRQALAEGLERVAAAGEGFKFFSDTMSLSWVFSSFFALAHSSDELREISKQVADEQFGNISDWKEAETYWAKAGIALSDLVDIKSGVPWFDAQGRMRRFPLSLDTARWTDGARIPTEEALEHLLATKNVPPILARVTLGSLSSHQGMRNYLVQKYWPKLAEKFLEHMGRLYLESSFVFRAANWAKEDEHWLNTLDKLGRHTSFHTYFAHQDQSDVTPLTDLFRMFPDRRGLIPLIVESVSVPPTFANAARGDALDIPVMFFDRDENPKIRRALIILELWRGNLKHDRAVDLANETIQMHTQQHANVGHILYVVSQYGKIDESLGEYLLILRKSLPNENVDDQAVIINVLNDLLRRRESGLAVYDSWQSLDLPHRLLGLLENPH